MKKLLQILGVVLLVLIVLGTGAVIIFKIAYNQYEKAEALCVKSSRSEVLKLYEVSPKDNEGTARINNITLQDYEKEMEDFYHNCMNDKDVPDSFLKLKSPYLFD